MPFAVLFEPQFKLMGADPRSLKYKFEDLDGIIFGLNTSYDNKLKIADIIIGKCKQNNRTGFNFYQAFYDQRTGKIGHHHMSLVKWES